MRNLGEEEQNERLHELFDHIDANGNELLDPTELTQHLKEVHNKYLVFDVDFWVSWITVEIPYATYGMWHMVCLEA